MNLKNQSSADKIDKTRIWEIIADNLKIWIVDAHRDDGKRFVVRGDEKLTAFLELERAIYACAVSSML